MVLLDYAPDAVQEVPLVLPESQRKEIAEAVHMEIYRALLAARVEIYFDLLSSNELRIAGQNIAHAIWRVVGDKK